MLADHLVSWQELTVDSGLNGTLFEDIDNTKTKQRSCGRSQKNPFEGAYKYGREESGKVR